jgi:hypothetical protein
VEVGRRLGISGTLLFDAPISQAVGAAANIVQGRFGASVGDQDEDQEAVARDADKDRGEDQ